MFARRPHTILIAITLASAGASSVVGCSLAIGTSDIDQGCGAGRKWCEETCVDVHDPAYGCSATSCDPCRQQNAITGCSEQVCQVLACVSGYAACGASDGCDTNVLTDPNNCGKCLTVCPALQICLAGVCGPPPS